MLQARVEAAGGQILFWNGVRVMGLLAVSRAIGDHSLRPYVIAEPEVGAGMPWSCCWRVAAGRLQLAGLHIHCVTGSCCVSCEILAAALLLASCSGTQPHSCCCRADIIRFMLTSTVSLCFRPAF